MITNSITHALQSILQYTTLVIALVLYQWIKDVFPFSRLTRSSRAFDPYSRVLKGRRTHSSTCDKQFMLYQWIRQLRKKHELTQEKLAEKLGVDPRTVQRWEQGTRPQPRHYRMFQQLEQVQRGQQSPKKRKIYPSPRRRYLAPHYRLWLLILIAVLVVDLILTILRWLHII